MSHLNFSVLLDTGQSYALLILLFCLLFSSVQLLYSFAVAGSFSYQEKVIALAIESFLGPCNCLGFCDTSINSFT